MAENRFDYIREMIAKGDVAGAIKSLASTVQANGRDVEAWLLLAEILDDPARKRDCYQQVLKWSPGNPTALQGLEKLAALASIPAGHRSSSAEAASVANPPQGKPSLLTERRRPSKLIRLVAFEFLFLVLGILGSNLKLALSNTSLEWQKLSPPPDKAVQIVTGNSFTVRVQTASGAIYDCNYEFPQKCWVKSDQTLYGSSLGYEDPYHWKPPLLSGVIDRKEFFAGTGDYEKRHTVYAITDKGEVYVWWADYGSFDGLIYFCVAPLAMLCGFIFWGVFELSLTSFFKDTRQKAQRLLEGMKAWKIPSPAPLRAPLFWAAWLLFLVALVMPQIGQGSPQPQYVLTIYGWRLAPAAVTALPRMLGNFFYFLKTRNLPQLSVFPFSFATAFSALSFIVSPLLLLFTRSSSRRPHPAWLVYALINLACVVLFFTTISTTHVLVRTDPNYLNRQLLPGFIVWTGAQIMLTIAAFSKS